MPLEQSIPRWEKELVATCFFVLPLSASAPSSGTLDLCVKAYFHLKGLAVRPTDYYQFACAQLILFQRRDRLLQSMQQPRKKKSTIGPTFWKNSRIKVAKIILS